MIVAGEEFRPHPVGFEPFMSLFRLNDPKQATGLKIISGHFLLADDLPFSYFNQVLAKVTD